MNEYYIGQIFEENPETGQTYPDDVFAWCNAHGASVREIDPITKEFEEPLVIEQFVEEPEPHVERTESTQMVLHTVRRFEIYELPPPPPPTHEEVRQMRAYAYQMEVDPLHAERQRKTILGTWTDEDEAQYIINVTQKSQEIVERYPYPEE